MVKEADLLRVKNGVHTEEIMNYLEISEITVALKAELVLKHRKLDSVYETKILKIKIQPENFKSPQFFYDHFDVNVNEGTVDIGKVIAVVKAFDLDLIAPYNTITYQLGSEEYFSINNASGEIRLIKELQKGFNLIVTAIDNINRYGSEYSKRADMVVQIIVNKNVSIKYEPYIQPESLKFGISNNDAPGTLIGTLHVLDHDVEPIFNYYISDNENFALKPFYDENMSKTISYKESVKIILNKYLADSNISKYDVLIEVSDGKYTTNKSIVIVVYRIIKQPLFSSLSYEVTLIENEFKKNISLVALSVNDEYKGDYTSFNIYSTPYLDSKWFSIDSRTGVIMLKRSIFRETDALCETYYLPISVHDTKYNLKSFINMKINLIATNQTTCEKLRFSCLYNGSIHTYSNGTQ